MAPPPAEFDAQLLADAITAALPKATVPAEDRRRRAVRVGPQHDVRALDLARDRGRRRGWPGTSPSTRPSRPRTPAASRYRIEHAHELDGLRCREHARRLIAGAWQRGRPRRRRRDALRRWAHQFGFGGHCFTKSRRFSTTFKALREARAAHAAGRAARRRGRREK